MASTYSNLGIELIGTGDQSGTWGTTTNTNLGTALEEAIVGTVNQAVTAVDLTLPWSTASNATQVARHLRLNLTGSSGGASNLIVPTLTDGKNYIIKNSSDTAITVKTAAGTGILVPAGNAMSLYQDGTNVVDAVTHMSSLTLTTALAIAQGGTGATTADTALDNLGGTTVGKGVFKAATAAAAQQAMDTEVGVDVQAYDAGLTDIAGLAVTDGNIIVGDGTNWTAESGATARTSLGLIIGTDVQAYDAATAKTDVAQSFTAKQTFTGATASLASAFINATEYSTISATAATGTIDYDVTTQSVLYYTTDASANWTVNVRGNGTTSLDTLMTTGDSLTVVFLVTQGATAYYNNALTIDGSSVTPKYQGGTAPTSGNASSIDAYSYTIVKTGSAAFTVLAAQTQFA
jgi:hypothetical protein